MSILKKYFLFFVSAIMLTISLVLLMVFGMSVVVGILLAVGIICCLSCCFFYANKIYVPSHYEEPKTTLSTAPKPKVKSLEEESAPKNDYVEPTAESTAEKEQKTKNKPASKTKSFRPKMDFETGFDAKTSIKEEDVPTMVCPHCKYKNYSTEIYCQNCGENLNKK